MESHPTLLYRVGEGTLRLIGDQHPCMPSGTSVQQVEDGVVMDEEEITLNLLVEGVGNVHTAHVVWAWFRPHAADPARVADLGDQI